MLGAAITAVVVLLRGQGQSWGRVMGMLAVLVVASGLVVLLLVAGFHRVP